MRWLERFGRPAECHHDRVNQALCKSGGSLTFVGHFWPALPPPVRWCSRTKLLATVGRKQSARSRDGSDEPSILALIALARNAARQIAGFTAEAVSGAGRFDPQIFDLQQREIAASEQYDADRRTSGGMS